MRGWGLQAAWVPVVEAPGLPCGSAGMGWANGAGASLQAPWSESRAGFTSCSYATNPLCPGMAVVPG